MTVGENTADIAGIAMMLLNDQNGTGHTNGGFTPRSLLVCCLKNIS
jgi:hypothetical protein